MGAVPVTISGVALPKNKKDKPFPVTIIGYAWSPGLKPVHPIVIPPEKPTRPGDAHPEHPIVLPPVDPDAHPDHTLPGDLPHPEHPIVLPPDWEIPPLPDFTPSEPKPPPADGGWGWSPEYGWGYFPGPTQPGPKGKK